MSVQKLLSISLAGLIFTTLSNLFFVIPIESAYRHGMLIDYLLPKIHLSDFFLVAVVGLAIVQNRQVLQKKISQIRLASKSAIVLATALLLLFFQFFATAPVSALWQYGALVKIVVLAWALRNQTKVSNNAWIHGALLATIFFQTSLAVYQFLEQRSLFGYLFFGEPNLSRYGGLAKSTLFGPESILPYGTTAHPNVLAGGMVVLSLWLWLVLKKRKKITPVLKAFSLFTISLAILTILLTQSISALAALLVAILLLNIPRMRQNQSVLMAIVIAGFLLSTTIFAVYKESPYTSIQRRSYLQTAAIRMVAAHPLNGVGLQNFAARVEEFSKTREVVRFTQPVHNTAWLWLAETGLVGVIFAIAGYRALGKETRLQLWQALTVVSPILFLDHYLLTLQTGLLLFILLFVIFRRAW